MKKEDALKDNFLNMKNEFYVSYHKTSRDINNVFNEELKRFSLRLLNFNNDYHCIDMNQLEAINNRIKDLFNSCKVILLEDYQKRFTSNVEALSYKMYEFYLRKLNNSNLKAPSKDINKYLNEICRFDCFYLEDKLENGLIDFMDDFTYHFINSDSAKRDFQHLIKNVNYSLMCELKKVISTSIADKQDIATRYNSENKLIVNSSNPRR